MKRHKVYLRDSWPVKWLTMKRVSLFGKLKTTTMPHFASTYSEEQIKTLKVMCYCEIEKS